MSEGQLVVISKPEKRKSKIKDRFHMRRCPALPSPTAALSPETAGDFMGIGTGIGLDVLQGCATALYFSARLPSFPSV